MKKSLFLLLVISFFPMCRKANTEHQGLFFYPGFSGNPLPFFNPIRQTKEIIIPDLVGTFNPGFIKHRDGFLLMPRFYGYKGLDHKSQIAVAMLDSNFSPKDEIYLLDTKINGETVFVEDPRLFYFRKELWVVISAVVPSVENGIQQMFISKLSVSDDGTVKAGPFTHIKVSKKVIKNLAPFEFNGELHFVYSMNPHRILKVDTVTGDATEVANTPGFHWKFGPQRGGSTVIPFGADENLQIFHSSEEYMALNGKIIRIYVMGAYTFENTPPFRVTRYTKIPIADETYYDDRNPHMIIFPTGAHISNENTLYVTFGKNDDSMFVSEIDIQKLVEGMTVIKY